MQTEGTAAYNSTYPKVAVQWLNEVQFFNQSLVLKIRHFLKWQAVGGQAKATKHQPS